MDTLAALNQLIEELQKHADALRASLDEALDVIGGLAGQQAMYDDWFEEPTRRMTATLDNYDEFLMEER